MRCAGCGRENRPGRRFCTGCGAALAAACPSCGAGIDAGERFCGSCGAPVAPSVSPRAAEPDAGERRQLTVLFCDLVGSTELSGRLDPEEWQDLVRAYQEATAAVVEKHGGHV